MKIINDIKQLATISGGTASAITCTRSPVTLTVSASAEYSGLAAGVALQKNDLACLVIDYCGKNDAQIWYGTQKFVETWRVNSIKNSGCEVPEVKYVS